MYTLCTDINNKKFKVKSKNLIFRPSVYGVIIKNGKIFLANQWDGYDYPGGAVELGERLKKALKREVFEESSVKIKIKELLYCKDCFFKLKYGQNKFVHSILIYYLCEMIGGKPGSQNLADYEKDYMGEPKWFDIDKIEKIKFYNSIDNFKLIQKAKAALKKS
ncbi:MAG: NUDIX domain-containing protein [Candidatus Moranbacteria bacterium]|nr:NUDIX domain-containing protein [Candidatus Moranbacteria bacterium]